MNKTRPESKLESHIRRLRQERDILLMTHIVIGYPSLEGKSVPFDIRTAIDGIQESVDRALELLAEECEKRIQEVSTSWPP